MRNHVLMFSTAMVLAGSIGLFVTEAGISSYNAVFIRCLVAAILMGGFVGIKGQAKSITARPEEIKWIVICGFALVGNWYFLFESFRLSSITIGIASYYTAPFFLLIFSRLILKENIPVSSVLWTVIGFTGLLTLVGVPDPDTGPQGNILPGIMSGITAAALYASVILLGKQVTRTRPTVVTAIQMILGAVAIFPFTTFTPDIIAEINWPFALSLGVFHTALLYTLFYASVRKISAGLIAPLAFIEPLTAILLDFSFYGTRLSNYQIFGICIILLSSYRTMRGAER
nr:DMT family transporter [uncultured Desulfobacter sp.]